MLAGNPDKFAFLIERVNEWESEGFVNGVMHVYINGKAYPKKLHTTTLNVDIAHLFNEDYSAFLRPTASRKIYTMKGKKLFKQLRRLRFPAYYGDDKEADEDYRFDVSLEEISNARYHVFVVTDGQKVRLLVGRWKNKKHLNKCKFLDETEITAKKYQEIINRVYLYFHNNVEPASWKKEIPC